MRNAAAAALVFSGGFIVLVLEIVGARYLAKDFGGSFYVWVSQIGIVMVALALGYYGGGALADRFPRFGVMGLVLAPAGLLTLAIPDFAPRVIDAIIARHPIDEPIPILWQKLDPAAGSAVVFLLPCLALAALPPYTIRLSTRNLHRVGRLSGFIIAASTVGSIAGVFAAGYVLIDHFRLSTIFRAMGACTLLLAAACVGMDRPASRTDGGRTDGAGTGNSE